MSQFTEVIKGSTNFGQYASKKPRIMEMLLEVDKRIPWQRHLTQSMLKQIRIKGRLSAKQESLITSLYIDSCVVSDAEIQRQIECRKLCGRLKGCRLGRLDRFITSVWLQTYQKRFSPAQMRAINNIAEKCQDKLDDVPELPPDAWDADCWGLTNT